MIFNLRCGWCHGTGKGEALDTTLFKCNCGYKFRTFVRLVVRKVK